MKKFTVSAYCLLLIITFSTQAALQPKEDDKRAVEKNKIVNAKCHVSLVDGSEAIIFYRLKSNDFPRLSNKIVGKKVLTQKSINKIKVYQVFECVLEQNEFTSSNSQSLDKKTER
jgi:hypothetical protein